MGFSTAFMIDFALNLAAYTLVAFLVYLLFGRRDKAAATARKTLVPPAIVASGPVMSHSLPGMEFVSLAEGEKATPVKGAEVYASGARPEAERVLDRRENRRAIYREARRLLARGQSHADLLQRLPLTEGELEMLSVTGSVTGL